MPTFYNYTEGGVEYSFDDVFVPADAFRQGNVWTWGEASGGKSGDNTGVNRSTPVTTFAGGNNWRQIACVGATDAAIKSDGTLWIWGYNSTSGTSTGSIGDNTGVNKSTPVTTFAGGTNWRQVAGGYAAAAIKTDGTLWTWGYSLYGALGDNSSTSYFGKSTPVTTFAGGTNWKQVSGGQHMAAIKTDGTLWLWGRNSFGGQPRGGLGVNDNTDRYTPVTTFAGGTNWKQVSCGYYHTAAIKTDGTLWVWGYNNFGQLGDNTTSVRCTPVTTFAGGTNWKQISCGNNITAAIKTDGTLWTWGYNILPGLGINDGITRSTPVTTFAGGTNWKQISCGNNIIGAIKTDGTLWTWGYNAFGQLGDNTSISKSTPITTFAGGTNWKQVSCSLGSRMIASTYLDDYV